MVTLSPRSWSVVLVWTCLSLVLATAFADSKRIADPPRIRSIIFSGADQVSTGDLRDVMRLRQKAWWKPFQKNYYYGTDHLEVDLERIISLYRGRGFIFAKLTSGTVRFISREWVDIEIEVNEGQRVYLSEKEVVGGFSDITHDLDEQIYCSPGSPMTERELTVDESRILTICQNEGYALAEVTRETHITGDSATVIYQLAPGPLVRVGDINVRGLERTLQHVVLREVVLKENQPFRLHQVIRTQERLFDLGLFRTVRMIPTYGSAVASAHDHSEVLVDLTVDATEKRPGWYGFGFGISSSDQARATGEWGFRNLSGRARAIQAKAEISYSLTNDPDRRLSGPKEWLVETAGTWPWLFGTPTRGQLRTYYKVKKEPVSAGEHFELRNLGVVFSSRWDLSRYRRLIGSLENKWTTEDSISVEREYTTRFISLGFTDDRRDFILDPHRGTYRQGIVEYAGGFLGGTATFLRATGTYVSFVPLGHRITWAHRVRAGYIRPIGQGIGDGEDIPLYRVPYDERFFAGGGTTIRGYAGSSLGPYEYSNDGTTEGLHLGGLAIILLNAELRFKMFWQLSGVFFFDTGNVWSDWREIKWSRWSEGFNSKTYSPLNAVFSIGAGLRFMTPVGPLRLDYGRKAGPARRPLEFSAEGDPIRYESDGEWHFSLGHAF
jgi:outer membrane protein insertion porin family